MEAAIQGSDLAWTILRPPALFDKEAPGSVELSTSPLGGHVVARQDLAAAMLAVVTTTPHLQCALYIGSLEGKPNIWRDAIRKKS